MQPVTTTSVRTPSEQKHLSGGDNKPAIAIPAAATKTPVKTPEEFKQLCQHEYKHRHNQVLAEYHEKSDYLATQRDRKIAEFEFISCILGLNTALMKGEPDTGLLMEVENQVSALNYETVAASYSLRFWREQYGEGLIVQILCDVMNYFLLQFQVKEKLTDLQIMQLAARLLSSQPKLRICELVFVLNNALKGQYGPTYQRIGIDTILQWLNRFYDDSSAYLESKRLNAKPEESRGATPWDEIEKRLQRYENEQREKKRITEKVYGFEKRKQEVEEYKNNLSIRQLDNSAM